MSETLVVSLTLMTVMSILALLVGGMIGWMARQHSYETTPQVVYTHPEMFDANGHLVTGVLRGLLVFLTFLGDSGTDSRVFSVVIIFDFCVMIVFNS